MSFSGTTLYYSLFYCDNHRNQVNLEKKKTIWAYVPEGQESLVAEWHHGNKPYTWRQEQETRGLTSWMARKQTSDRWCFILSRFTFSEILPTRSHLLSLPKQRHQQRDKYVNARDYREPLVQTPTAFKGMAQSSVKVFSFGFVPHCPKRLQGRDPSLCLRGIPNFFRTAVFWFIKTRILTFPALSMSEFTDTGR